MRTIIIIYLLLLSFKTWAIKPTEAILPEDCVRLFYQELLTNQPVDKCAAIFDEPKTFFLGLTLNKKYKALTNHTTENGVIWTYLKDNKKAFMLDYFNKADDIGKRLMFGYFFLPVQGPDFFKKASLNVVVYSPLKSKIGVWKQVFFPLVYNEISNTPKYLIDLVSLRINGIKLENHEMFNRSSNLYEELGIQVDDNSKENEK